MRGMTKCYKNTVLNGVSSLKICWLLSGPFKGGGGCLTKAVDKELRFDMDKSHRSSAKISVWNNDEPDHRIVPAIAHWAGFAYSKEMLTVSFFAQYF